MITHYTTAARPRRSTAIPLGLAALVSLLLVSSTSLAKETKQTKAKQSQVIIDADPQGF